MTIYTDVFGSNTPPPAEYGYRAVTLTADTTFVWPYNTNDSATTIAKILDVTCDSGNSLILPDAQLVSTGEDFLIRNVGSNALTVKDAGGNVVGMVIAGAASYFYLTDNTTEDGVFGVIAYGVGTSSVDAASLVGYGIKAIGSSLNQAHSVSTMSSDNTIDAADRAKLLVFTGGDGTFTLPDAMATGDDFFVLVRNSGTGTLTLDATGANLVDGQSSLTVQPSESLIVFCSGLAWYSVGYGRSIAYQFSQLVKDVSAGGTITLTAAEAANKLITFIGNPAANLTVVVPPIAAVYYTYNAISTAFTVTVKTALGLGSAIPQTNRAILLCDGTDILSAQSFIASTTLSVLDGTVALPAINFVSQTNTGIYKVGTKGWGVSVDGVSVFELEENRAVIDLPQDYIKLDLQAVAPVTDEGSFYYNSTTKQIIYYSDVGAVPLAGLASPVFTGNPTAPTPPLGDDDTSIATTAFAMHMRSPAFTGNPTAPTPAPGDSDTSLATTEFAMNMQSPAFMGTPRAPTAPFGTSTTQLATTAFAAALSFSSALPAQLGNAGKFVSTDGTTASWETVIPDQTGKAGEFLTTDGANTEWKAVPDPVGSTLYLANNFT